MERLPTFLVAMSRSSQDVAGVLELGAQAAATILGTPAVVLIPEGRRLLVAAASEPEPARGLAPLLAQALEDIDLDRATGPIAALLSSGSAQLVDLPELLKSDPDTNARWALKLAMRDVSGLALTPLLAGDHPLGLLLTAWMAGQPHCTAAQLATQAQLAGHLSTFIDTATALTQMRHSTLVLDAVPDAIIGFSRDREVILWNEGATRMYGITEEEALGQPLDELVSTEYGPPGMGSGSHGPAISLINKGRWTGRVRQHSRDGRMFHVDLSIASIVENGVLRGAVSINRDITGLIEAEERKAEHERRMQALLDASQSPTAVFDASGVITAVNSAWQGQQPGGGLAGHVGLGNNYLAALGARAADSADAAAVLAGTGEVLAGRVEGFRHDYDLVHADGTIASYEVRIAPMPGPNRGAFATHTDITSRKAMERQLSHQASHDPLTGLLTRRKLELELEPALAAAAAAGTAVGAIILDLDRFKDVNDTLGHPAGDRVLVAMAVRLRRFGPASLVARLAGNEFALAVPGVRDRGELARLAGDVRRIVAEPLVISGRELFFGANIGTALSSDTPAGPEAPANLLRAADTAMYRAKERGRNSIVAYDEGLRADAERRVQLSSWLERALEHGEISVNYQGQFSCLDGKQVGVEALVRWHHPEAGEVSPAEFISIAEESGTIVQIGTWVLREACQRAREWVRLADQEFSVAVNLSPLQLIATDLIDTVRAELLRSRLPAGCLTLEVTEGALIEDPEAASQALARLRALGVRISIDDFGTGYSSLAYLARFPVDELKVDRMFVRDLERDPRTRALAEGIVRIGHALGMRVVAEGVETPGQLRILSGAAADCYQGYLACRAENPEAVTERLTRAHADDLSREAARAAGRIWQ